MYAYMLSPRMRGCFLDLSSDLYEDAAFPAYAGMFLKPTLARPHPVSFPRVCGDVSLVNPFNSAGSMLSPRMRGCFYKLSMKGTIGVAFPAYAGMFLGALPEVPEPPGFPRVCGDVS